MVRSLPSWLVGCLGCLAASVTAGALHAQGAPFLRGDSNLDGSFDVSDAVFTMRMVFLGEPPAGCDDAADVDDDGRLNVTDAIFGMRFLFLDGLPPPAPFDRCGADLTADGLACEQHPSCAADVPCIDQQAIDELLGNALAFTFCVPAGVVSIPGDTFSVEVCPAEGASPCGELQQPGCPVELTSVTGALRTAEAQVVLRFEGRVVDLPIAVTESLFNSTTTCLTDFHGAAPEDPFSFEMVLPLVVEQGADGKRRITGVGESALGETVMQLTATGGLVCRLFQAGQAAFIQLLLAPLDAAAKSISQQLAEGLVGLELCVQ